MRDDDSRGRHTTTHRELVVVAGRGLVIDTPGMRELQLWDADAGLSTVFADVELVARGCRFADCAHEAEPGCAVIAAAAGGALDPARLESWRKLQRELRHLAAKQDVRLRAAEQARWKAIHRSMKHHPKAHRWR